MSRPHQGTALERDALESLFARCDDEAAEQALARDGWFELTADRSGQWPDASSALELVRTTAALDARFRPWPG